MMLRSRQKRSGRSPPWVASLTKPVFSVGVLQLVQQGLLELDRPLQAYLPQPYLAGVDFLDEITARHTLTHTATP